MTDVFLIFAATVAILSLSLVVTAIILSSPSGLLWGLLVLAFTMFELMDIFMLVGRAETNEPSTASVALAAGILSAVLVVLLAASRRCMVDRPASALDA